MRLVPVRAWFSGLILALAIGGIAWSFAPDAASSGALLHPADSVIYLSYDGGLAHEAEFKKTAAYEGLYQSGLMDAFMKAAERLKSSAGEIPEKEAKILGRALELAREAMDRGGSFSLVLAPPQQGPPTVSGTLVLNQCGRFRSDIEALLKEALEKEQDVKVEPYSEAGKAAGLLLSVEDGPMGARITLFEKNGHLIVNAAMVVGGNSPARDVSFAALSGQGKNVSAHRLYKDGAAERNFVQNGLGWIDFQPIKAMFGEMPLPPPRTGAKITVSQLLGMLGVDTLEAVVSRCGYKDRATWSEVSVIAPGPRKGLMALLDQPAFTFTDLPPIASKPLSVLASSVDAGLIYDQLVGTFKEMSTQVNPQAIDEFDQAVAQIEQVVGFNLRQDFLGTLKGPMVIALDGGGSQSFDAVQVSLKTSDGDRLKGTLEKIFGLAGQASQGEVTFEKATKYGREMSVMRIRQAPIVVPTFCIDKGYLHIGLLPQAVEMALLRTDGKLPRWKPTGDTAEGLKLLPTNMTGLSFSDTPTMYGRIIGQAPLLLGFMETGFRQANPNMDFPLKAEDLPPAEVVSSVLFPNLSISTVDQEGAKAYSRNSLPGSEMFLSTGGVAVMVALLLPAVQQAREAARRTESKNNLKQIGLALHNYHDVYNAFPSGTVPTSAANLDDRLSWQVSVLPFLEQAALYNQFNMKSGWNATANQQLSQTNVPTFIHPTLGGQEPGATNYVGLAGVGQDGPKLDAKNKKAGIFAYDKGRSIRDITDGTSNTAMVIESNRPANWAAGGQGTIRPLTTAPYINGPDGFGGISPGGANVLMADGSVRFVSDRIDPKVMESITTIAGGEVVNDF